MASNIRKCEGCRAPFTEEWRKDDKGNYICPHCGVVNDFTYAEAPEDDPRAAIYRETSEIYPLLENLAFDAADRKLSELRKKYPTSSKVWFLSALSQYYVCYTRENDRSDKYIPTLNNLNLESLKTSQFVAKALELAPSTLVKKQYQETFDYIETKRSEIQRDFEKKENKYDIFISVKIGAMRNGKPVLDEDGHQVKSRDCAIAMDVYNYLRQAGYNVFFSESEDFKEKVVGNRYENIIYAALHSAKAFLLFGESIENLESRWVKNEWLRYLYLKDNEKPDEAGTHHMVLITKTLSEGDLPRELQGNQFINFNSVTASRQLDAFLAKALSSGKSKKVHLEAKTFDTEVAKIDLSSLKDDGFVARKLATSQAKVTQSEQADLERIAESLDPKYPRDREESFEELEAMVANNPDFYEAKKLLLLKGTNYFHFEDYIQKPDEVASNPKIAKDFLEFATEKDAKDFLNDLIATMAAPSFYFRDKKEDIAKEDDAKRRWVRKQTAILDSLITPYLSSLKKESIKAYYKKLGADIRNYVDGKSKDEQNLLTIYFGLDRYLSGKDALAYCKVREDYLKALGKRHITDPDALAFCEKTLKEIIEVNPGAVEGPWTMFFVRHNLPVVEPEEAVKQIEAGTLSFPVVGHKENLDSFEQFIRYAPAESRPIYLQAFLSLLVDDNNAYAEEEDGSLKLSESADAPNEKLNGIDLFNKYIGYPLPKTVYPSTANVPFAEATTSKDGKVVQKEPLFVPNVDVYAKKAKPLPIDRLISRFAVKMHKAKHFEEAHTFYQLYLGQQPGPNSLDYALVRYYDELAKIHVLDSDSLLHTGRPLDHKSLENDLIQLRKAIPEANKLYVAVKEASNFQRDYTETYQSIKEITAQIPAAWHIDDISNLKRLQSSIEDAIGKVGKGVANDIRKEFEPVLNRFNQELPAVTKAKKIIDEYFPKGEINEKEIYDKILAEAQGQKKKGKGSFKTAAPDSSESFIKKVEAVRDETLLPAIVDYDVPSAMEEHKKAIKKQADAILSWRRAADARDKRFRGYKAILYGIGTFFLAILNTLVMGIPVLASITPIVYTLMPDLTGFIISASGFGLTILFFFIDRYFAILPSERWVQWHNYVFRCVRALTTFAAAAWLTIYCIPHLNDGSWMPFALVGGALVMPFLYIIYWYVIEDTNFFTLFGGICYVALRGVLLVPAVIVLIELFKGWGGVNCFTDGFYLGMDNISPVGMVLAGGGLAISAIWSGIQSGVHIHHDNDFVFLSGVHKVFSCIYAVPFAIVALAAGVFGILSFGGTIGMSIVTCFSTCTAANGTPFVLLVIGAGSAVAAYFELASSFNYDYDFTMWFI